MLRKKDQDQHPGRKIFKMEKLLIKAPMEQAEIAPVEPKNEDHVMIEKSMTAKVLEEDIISEAKVKFKSFLL